MSDPPQLPRLPRFTICGLGDVAERSRERAFSHVVSIWDVEARGDGPAEVAALFPASRLLQVRFDDLDIEAASAVTRSMVGDILRFGAGLGPDDAVLVHCLAGVSRSAGVAYALACQYAPPGEEDAVLRWLVARHPWIKPNRRVVAFADGILRRDGRMNAAVGEIWAKLTRTFWLPPAPGPGSGAKKED
jgi:predicted protein tyrosine phosphatase